ncbi:MAG: hypothetical protein IH621_16760 [Krumholzibacteria bacterium]|nr:hypothetical protein [Candidatus Krumholzibacteria bacterium]
MDQPFLVHHQPARRQGAAQLTGRLGARVGLAVGLVQVAGQGQVAGRFGRERPRQRLDLRRRRAGGGRTQRYG